MAESPDSHALQAASALPEGLAVLKMEHETMMAMAVARPRQYGQILASIVEQVELFPGFAEKAVYSKPVGKETFCKTCKRVLEDWKASACPRCGPKQALIQRPVFATGLSIRAAEAIAEAYGYNRVRCNVTMTTPDLANVQATFVDYQRGRTWEKNVLVSRMQKRRDGSVYRLSDERFELLQNAKASIVTREVILRSTPPGLRAALEAKVRGLVRLTPEVIAKVHATFSQKGVELEKLEEFLGKPKAEWANDDRQRLLETLTAIEDGEATVEEVFGTGAAQEAAGAEGKPEAKKDVAARAKEKLKKPASGASQASPTGSTPSGEGPEFAQPENGDGPPPGFENG